MAEYMTKAEVHEHVHERLKQFASMLGEELGLTQKHQLATMKREIEKLCAQSAPDRASKATPVRTPVIRYRLQSDARLRR